MIRSNIALENTKWSHYKNDLNVLPLSIGALRVPPQHCRETGGCSEVTCLMAQECWLAASIPACILVAQETAHPLLTRLVHKLLQLFLP